MMLNSTKFTWDVFFCCERETSSFENYFILYKARSQFYALSDDDEEENKKRNQICTKFISF